MYTSYFVPRAFVVSVAGFYNCGSGGNGSIIHVNSTLATVVALTAVAVVGVACVASVAAVISAVAVVPIVAVVVGAAVCVIYSRSVW